MRRQFFANERQKLHDDRIYRIDASIKSLNEESLIDVLLYGSDRYNDSQNKQLLLHSICYIQFPKRFERPLTDQCYFSITFNNKSSVTAVVFFLYMSTKGLSAMNPFILLILIFSQILSFFEKLYWIFQLLWAAPYYISVYL